jgi:hypothetical protein
MKNCGECKHLRIKKPGDFKFGCCSITENVVPQVSYDEDGETIVYMGIPSECPLPIQ